MANVKNLAASFVATAPSPATSGTSLVVTAATGANFPTAPFYATLTPTGSLSTPTTSEIVLVTAVSTDTLTITRAQKSTTAKTVAVGWVITNGIYVEDVFSTITFGEVMGGTANGSNTVFTTSSPATSIEVFKNGVRMKGGGSDYTVTNSTTITFVTAPASAAVILANYIIGNQVMITGSNSIVTDQTPTGTVNGSTTVFTASQAYIPGSLQVFINGVKQKRTTHFTETSPGTGSFTMSDAPLTGDDIMVSYQYTYGVTANSDTVDGYHAASTATANTLFPLDSSARLPLAGTNRQDDTTNTITAPRIESGWGVVSTNSSTSIYSETVTFSAAFASRPIVVMTFGGDSNVAATYGSGGSVIEANVNVKAHTITTTNFVAYLRKPDNTNYGGTGFAFYQWIAIGV